MNLQDTDKIKFPNLAPWVLAFSGVLMLVASAILADGGSLKVWLLAKAVYVIGLIMFIKKL